MINYFLKQFLQVAEGGDVVTKFSGAFRISLVEKY